MEQPIDRLAPQPVSEPVWIPSKFASGADTTDLSLALDAARRYPAKVYLERAYAAHTGQLALGDLTLTGFDPEVSRIDALDPTGHILTVNGTGSIEKVGFGVAATVTRTADAAVYVEGGRSNLLSDVTLHPGLFDGIVAERYVALKIIRAAASGLLGRPFVAEGHLNGGVVGTEFNYQLIDSEANDCKGAAATCDGGVSTYILRNFGSRGNGQGVLVTNSRGGNAPAIVLLDGLSSDHNGIAGLMVEAGVDVQLSRGWFGATLGGPGIWTKAPMLVNATLSANNADEGVRADGAAARVTWTGGAVMGQKSVNGAPPIAFAGTPGGDLPR